LCNFVNYNCLKQAMSLKTPGGHDE
jgi:hypothetical protein